MFDEREIGTFVHGTTRYFEVSAQQPATIGSPFLVTHGSAGDRRLHRRHQRDGPTQRARLLHRAARHADRHAHEDERERRLPREPLRLVGEIANTISGNARRDFGRDFKISPPSVVSGPTRQVELPAGCRPFVVPINWRSHSARLVVGLK